MTKLNFESSGLANTAVLSIKRGMAFFACERVAAMVSERFLHSAALLPQGGFLGWQISAVKEKGISCYLFSSSGLMVTEDDYNWIFQKCATAEMMPAGKIRNLFEDNRKVYMLSSVLENQSDGRLDKQADDFKHTGYEHDDGKSYEYFQDLFHMLMDADAVIQIVAGTSYGNTSEHGVIIISIPREISLRMRSIITLVFPHAVVEEIRELSGLDESLRSLPGEYLQRGMTQFIRMLTCQESENAKNPIIADDSCGADVDIENGRSYTPIEDLDLSVRAYNCLKRARIDTVEELRMMTDEDLRLVRNLGVKCITEIKQRLSETAHSSALAPLKASSYSAVLEDLIGLQNVKEQVKKISAFAKMRKDLSETGRTAEAVALNMEFTGNPGTAKTTVARIMAGIFYEIGLLSTSDMVEVGRADLVAKWEGQTADMVRSVFRKAKGKILFIDEAYSLVETWEDGFGGFGDEAISTIVQEMENNREDTIVIFTGYPNKMKEFFSKNPGLRSRVPFTLRFHDYSADEMMQIAELEAAKRGFSIAAEAKAKVMSICRMATDKPEAGNGRFCRNLVENAILNYASRVYGDDRGDTIGYGFALVEEDFAIPELILDEKMRAIGF